MARGVYSLALFILTNYLRVQSLVAPPSPCGSPPPRGENLHRSFVSTFVIPRKPKGLTWESITTFVLLWILTLVSLAQDDIELYDSLCSSLRTVQDCTPPSSASHPLPHWGENLLCHPKHRPTEIGVDLDTADTAVHMF